MCIHFVQTYSTDAKLKLANFKCFMSLYIVECKLHQGFFFQFYDIKKLTNFPKTLAKLVEFTLGFRPPKSLPTLFLFVEKVTNLVRKNH
jgi:hypothetical protein